MNNALARLGGYAEKECVTDAYRPPSIKESLLQRRQVLRDELDRIDAALQIFETEPRVADALEIITKAIR